jgi:hypothetical protein
MIVVDLGAVACIISATRIHRGAEDLLPDTLLHVQKGPLLYCRLV